MHIKNLLKLLLLFVYFDTLCRRLSLRLSVKRRKKAENTPAHYWYEMELYTSYSSDVKMRDKKLRPKRAKSISQAQKVGARVVHYRLSDLKYIDLANYKALVFINSTRITDADRNRYIYKSIRFLD